MTTGLQGFSQQGEGYVGIKITWRPGDVTDPHRFEAPEQFILAETRGLKQDYAHIEHDAFAGGRDTDKGHRHGKATSGGPFMVGAYPTNATDVWEAAFGFKAPIDGIAPDTTTGIHNGVMAVPTVPTTAPSGTGGTLPASTVEYAVALGTQYGQTQEGAHTAGDVLTGATSSVVLTDIAVGPIGTTKRLIYRKDGAGAFKLVHTLADNTTATWTDNGSAVPGAEPPLYNTSLPSGVSVFALTTGDANYKVPSKGRPIKFDSGFDQEIRPLLDYDATNKLVFVGLLGERDGRPITHASTGVAVEAPACDLERTIMATDFSRNYSNELPRVAVEDNQGGKYSWQYRDGLVNKLDIKASKDKVTVTPDVMFSRSRQLANGETPNPSPTAFDESDASMDELSFEYQDGFLAIESDYDSTQTPMLQRMDDAVGWELNLNNNLKQESPMDGGDVHRWIPGTKRKLDVKLQMLNHADYPVIYERFLKRDLDAQFFAHFAYWTGDEAAPAWKFRSFYCPHVRYVKSTEPEGLTDTTGENVEGVARRAGGMEKIYIYSIS